MNVVRSAREIARELEPRRTENGIGFVPTMGALHEGHLSLMRAARERCSQVVVSIFVNPLQFGAGEDFGRYPRDEEADLAALESEGVDVAFLPPVAEMYPENSSTTIFVGELATVVEGAFRPGHFDGVATVVAKLFNLVRPDAAFFGRKDAQQLAVIRRMVADLDFDLEIVGCPTVRESDGLALSSRNAYLEGKERQRATALWRALQEGKRACTSGADVDTVEKVMWEAMASIDGVEPDYARVVNHRTFLRPDSCDAALLVVAATVGKTRLIDNLSTTESD